MSKQIKNNGTALAVHLQLSGLFSFGFINLQKMLATISIK
jgi:hypothetical protein